jgi:hypothetical protein
MIGKLVVAAAALATGASAQDYMDTPLTTEMFHLISKSDPSKENHNELFENLLYSYPKMATARTADKRGAVWWAWEFENSFALGALMAYGDDIKKADEDDSGNSAFSMCPGSCDEIMAEAEGIAEEVKKRREARKAREDAELDEDDDDDDFGASESEDKPARGGKKDLNIDVDDEDEDL